MRCTFRGSFLRRRRGAGRTEAVASWVLKVTTMSRSSSSSCELCRNILTRKSAFATKAANSASSGVQGKADFKHNLTQFTASAGTPNGT